MKPDFRHNIYLKMKKVGILNPWTGEKWMLKKGNVIMDDK